MCGVIFMNEPCRILLWRSHVTYINGSRHVHDWVTSRTSMRRVRYMSEYEWVMSHEPMSMNESLHIHQWVPSFIKLSHNHPWDSSGIWMCIWMSHVTYTNECEWVLSLTSTSYAICMNESFCIHQYTTANIFEWVMLHISMSNVIYMNVYMNASSHIHRWVWLSHVTNINAVHEWVMSHTSMTYLTFYKWVMLHLYISA